jgi:hypothetical protein
MVSVDDARRVVISRADALMTPPSSKLTTDTSRKLEVSTLGLG